MYRDDDKWTQVTGDELDGFLAQVGTIDGRHNTSSSSTEVSWRPLPFYEQVVLIRLRDENWDPQHLQIFYLANQGQLTRLDGTSPPIHMVNAESPVKITDDNVLDYMRFFCYFVRGEEGPFLIAENIDDPAMPKNLDDSTTKVIEGVLRDASYEGKDDNNYWLCDAVVFYDDALFLANFAVQPSGMIEMLEDHDLVNDLGVRVDSPVS